MMSKGPKETSASTLVANNVNVFFALSICTSVALQGCSAFQLQSSGQYVSRMAPSFACRLLQQEKYDTVRVSGGRTGAKSSMTVLKASSTVMPPPGAQDLVPGIAAIDAENNALESLLSDLREESFFRLYSVDILGSCEYMPQELFECYSESCEIYPVDEEDIPEAIRAVDREEHDFELDGWARWDMPSDDYYDMKQFPEESTGYDGADVWRFIHQRICFKLKDEDDDTWQADFNKAVSGLHSMISAQVVRSIKEKIAAGEEVEEPWTDPRVEFNRRLGPNGETPRALENLYFGYMLLLSAVGAARDRLICDCNEGKIDDHAAERLRKVLASPLIDDPSISVASRKLHDHAVKNADAVAALWEARMRMRELMRITNCVQCNKCRLHSKVSIMGLSTALKVLLGKKGDGEDPTRVHRVELAALMTTLSKFSTAIRFSREMLSGGT